MTETKYEFQAEVGRLLDIVTNALYSQKEIFLRELVSNAADACDRLRYLALSDDTLLGSDKDFKITITPNKEAKTLTISDNGVGMSKPELLENLGTIAKSGTAAFLDKATKKEKADVNLIGQFGVGFYAAFMVAHKVEVISLKAGTKTAHMWTSEGHGSFEIHTAKRDERGTTIVLHMKEDAGEFLEALRLNHIVKTYSDYVRVPIIMIDDGQEKQINAAQALWTRPKADITPEQYKEFYNHIAHTFDDPWEILYFKAEGVVEYTAALFIPTMRPFDFTDPKRMSTLKLFIKRVFITDDCPDLLPSYLRFVKGMVDAEDLPLNVSREMLQREPRLHKIKKGLISKILSALKKRLNTTPEEYQKFWEAFGPVLKEGLYEDQVNQEALLDLCLFSSTQEAKPITLDTYIASMPKNQSEIFYSIGADSKTLAHNPALEGFAKEGLNVLLLSDAVDEFWLTTVEAYKNYKFKAATATDIVFEGDEKEAEKPEGLTKLEAFFKVTLGEKLKDVVTSKRLTTSPVCLVRSNENPHARLAQMMGQGTDHDLSDATLEINPDHKLIQFMRAHIDKETEKLHLEDMAHLLLDEALVQEGRPVIDPHKFSERLNRRLSHGH